MQYGIAKTGNGIISPTYRPPIKNYFDKVWCISFQDWKKISETGYGIAKTGNGIISSTSRLAIKKLLLQSVMYTFQGFRK